MKRFSKPSRLSEWLLHRLSKPGESFSTLGDFAEIYSYIARENGVFKARVWYWWQIVLAIPAYGKFIICGSLTMFRNYLKIALRNLRKHKAYSFINISGLSLGIACCLLILLYVQYELSYDRYHENADRIYRVSREWINSQGVTTLHLGHVAPPFGRILKEEHPEIEMMVRFIQPDQVILNYDGKLFSETRFFGADEDVFSMFSWKLLSGDPETALQAPNTLVMSESMAKKYFNEENPIGKVLSFTLWGTEFTVSVTGVMEDTPHNSHAHFDFFLSMASFDQAYPEIMRRGFGNNSWSTYLLFPENYDIEALSEQMNPLMRRIFNSPNMKSTLNFMKMTDIHLKSQLDSEIETNSDFTFIYTFSAIAFMVLLVACFNFMNLSTARSAVRAKEVGLRKVVGAYKNQLVTQFLSESVLMSVISLILAIGIVSVVMPQFTVFVEKPLTFNIFSNIPLLAGLFAIIIFVGFIAGSYPAFFLSAFRPLLVLKGAKMPNTKSSAFRSILAVGQFAISVMLLIAVQVVAEQMDFIRNKELGYDRERLINFNLAEHMIPRHKTIKNQLLQDPNITGVTVSSRIPTGRLADSASGRIAQGDTLVRVDFRLPKVRVDQDFFRTYGMEFVAGRDFSHELATDTLGAFIVNEATVEKLGLSSPSMLIDRPMSYDGIDGKIIGVVKDFHFESLHQPITPVIFYYTGIRFYSMTARIRQGRVEEAMNSLREMWNTYNPGMIFTYKFIDDEFDALYRSEEKLGDVFEMFSFLAIFIACLGLFGLASFTAERRIKEIGVRKVLGASAGRIITSFNVDFVKLLIWANILSWPIAYYFLKEWFLSEFAYRIDLDVQTFVFSGLATIVIGVLTVSIQATKAAFTNPVNTLRNE